MLCDPRERVLVSSLGWVDGGALWCLELAGKRERRLAIGDAKHLSLRAGTRENFAVVHHFEGERLEVTAHAFAQPEAVLARCVVTTRERRLEGDAQAWAGLPQHYVGYLRQPAWSAYALVRIARGAVSVQTFDWYDERYDKGYQGIVGVTDVPGAETVIVSVQRDSRPVLHDPLAGKKVGEMTLAGRYGNPALLFRRTAQELWADDYDTLLVLEVDSWRVLRQTRIQDAAAGTGLFMGQFAFDADERVCAVARPYGSDVLGLDPGTLAPVFRAETGGQPLKVAVLRDLSVYARDWKTGELRTGTLAGISGA